MNRAILTAPLAIFLLLATPCTADPVPGAACEAWLRSVEPYSLTLDAIVGGVELPADYRSLFDAIETALTTGDSQALRSLEARCRKIVVSIQEQAPPEELGHTHERILAYYAAVADGAERVQLEGANARNGALTDAVRALLAFYEQMLEDFREQGCETGDTEALREKIIPQLHADLHQLDSGAEEPPATQPSH